MSTSVNKEIYPEMANEVDELSTEHSTTLGQLGEAIQRSIVSFIIASIFLIVAFVLIVNRQNVLSEMSIQINKADQFHSETLLMQEAEKEYIISGLETHLVAYNQHYERAQEVISTLLANPLVTKKERDTLNRLQTNAQAFKRLFDQAVRLQNQRGFDVNDQGSVLSELRHESQKFYQVTQNGHLPSDFERALLRLRLAVQDYIILQSADVLPAVKNAGDMLRENIATSGSLTTAEKQELLEITGNYLRLFNQYAELSQQVQQLFADTTVAAHSSQYMIPTFTGSLLERQANISQQLFFILIATATILIIIFMIVVYQLRRAQRNTDETLNETIAAQERAEAENERLNDSVISILEAVNSLSQKDLRVRAPVTEDIVGTVSDSINALADETARVLIGVTSIAGRVSEVSDSVKVQAIQVSETAQEERESVNRMIESLLETTQVMNQVTALAEQTNESATQATTATDDALQTVTETVDGMDTIRQTISETEKRIKRLGERSQEISGIVNLINTISERTHVLALNASMQAAVAGEAGRGFAVVAQEVQQLAESSRHATDQIATLVNNIQIETNETINTVNRTISQVVEGTEQAQRAGTQMKRTQEITAELVASVASIANASQQQKTLSAQLLEAVQKIGESTERTAQQIAAQNSGTDDLQKAAADLVASVNVFKLPA